MLELVLDDHRTTVLVFGNEVDAEGADGLLTFDTAELKVGSLVEDVDVLLQPFGEVESLVSPHVTEAHTLNSSIICPTPGGSSSIRACLDVKAVVARRSDTVRDAADVSMADGKTGRPSPPRARSDVSVPGGDRPRDHPCPA